MYVLSLVYKLLLANLKTDGAINCQTPPFLMTGLLLLLSVTQQACSQGCDTPVISSLWRWQTNVVRCAWRRCPVVWTNRTRLTTSPLCFNTRAPSMTTRENLVNCSVLLITREALGPSLPDCMLLLASELQGVQLELNSFLLWLIRPEQSAFTRARYHHRHHHHLPSPSLSSSK